VSDKIDWREVRHSFLMSVEEAAELGDVTRAARLQRAADAIKAAYCGGCQETAAALVITLGSCVREMTVPYRLRDLVEARVRRIESGQEEP
jgi:hypothetical protein